MRKLIIAGLLLSSTHALALDYPASTRSAYGTIDHDSMTFDCTLQSNNTLHCTFAQTLVSRVGKTQNFEKELPGRIDEVIKDLKKNGGEQCANFGSIAEFVAHPDTASPPKDSGDVAKMRSSMLALSAAQRMDMLVLMNTFVEVCNNPTNATAEKLLRMLQERDLKTCKVWTQMFEQTFEYSPDGSWVSNQGPEGLCKVVTISHFDKAKDKYASSFWTYTTRKVVLNKDKTDTPLMSCADLDEREFFYDWKQGNDVYDCKYLKFGF